MSNGWVCWRGWQNDRQDSARRSCEPEEPAIVAWGLSYAAGRLLYCFGNCSLQVETNNSMQFTTLERTWKSSYSKCQSWSTIYSHLKVSAAELGNNKYFPTKILSAVPVHLTWARFKLLIVRKFAVRSMIAIYIQQVISASNAVPNGTCGIINLLKCLFCGTTCIWQRSLVILCYTETSLDDVGKQM